MEERVHSVDSDDFKDYNNDDPLPLPPALKSPPGHHPSASETYVVQVPKDQIYRVPPPENAIIAERYRNKPAAAKKPLYSRFFWVFISFLVLSLIVGTVVGVFYALFSPKNPQFSIARVVVKNTQPSSHKKNSQPKYEISLKAKNTNERMSVYYEGGGGVSLSFKQEKIAATKFPALSQGSGSSSTFKVVLVGSKGALPSEIKKSLKEKKSKGRQVPLALTMNVPMEIKIGIMKVWSMDMVVTCKFKVTTLAKGTKVLSQQCQTKT